MHIESESTLFFKKFIRGGLVALIFMFAYTSADFSKLIA